MLGLRFPRSGAVSVLRLCALVCTQLLLTQLALFIPEGVSSLTSVLIRVVVHVALFVGCVWLIELDAERRVARQDEARVAALVEASDQSIATIDTRGRIRSINKAMEVLFQRKQAAVLGQCIHTVPGLETSCLCGCAEPRRLEHRSGRFVYSGTGEQTAVLDWVLTPLSLGSGGGGVLALHDVSAEILALERAQLQAAALDAAANSIFITDTQGRIEWVNAAFKRTTGYGDEAIGQTPRILHSGRHDQSFYQRLWATVLSGQPWVGEMVNRSRDGNLFECLCTITPVAVLGGTATHFVAVAQDISQLRTLERRLTVSERMASLGTLAAGVAHEINNPLSFITSNLNYLRAYIEHGEGDRSEVVSALADATMGAQRVREIVLALRSFSRVGEGAPGSIELRSVLEQALTIAGSELKSRAQVRVDLGLVPMVRADEGRLAQVFLNLLVNAAQAIAPGAPGVNEIRVVSSLTSKGDVLVEISDTGCGLSDLARKHLFEPFFTTKPVGVGTGLGLYICHNLLHGMGGALSVESVEGKGSTFRVQLPAAEALPQTATHAA